MKFTQTHEWIVLEDQIAKMGISQFAQKELGEIVYIDLPKIGQKMKMGDLLFVLESTKSAADIYAPITGTVIEVNQELKENINLLNQSPEKAGWVCKIQPVDLKEVETLLDRDQYSLLIQ